MNCARLRVLVCAFAAAQGSALAFPSVPFSALGVTRIAARTVVLDPAGPGRAFVPDLVQGFTLLANPFDVALDVAAVFGSPEAPVPGITERVDAVWAWDAAANPPRWRFFSPQLSAAQNADHAAANGYGLLASVGAGESYWVSAYAAFALPVQSGAPLAHDAGWFAARPRGWSQLSSDAALPPAQFLAQVGADHTSVESLWMWDALLAKWYFFAPALALPEAPFTNAQYCAANGLLDFAASGRLLDPGEGFWVYRP